MIKLAILGSENSHAWGFSSALAPKDGEKMFPDVELIGMHLNPETDDGKIAMDKIKEGSSIKEFSADPEAFVDDADAVMVTARHGGDHLKFIRKYIEKGIPVWVDKPITCSPKEAEELIDLCKKYCAPVSGGSSLAHAEGVIKAAKYVRENPEKIIGGHITAPINMINNYGNFWFYSQHLVQMITEIFGIEIKSVVAKKDATGVMATYEYENFNVTAYFGTGYCVTVYTGGYDVITESVELGSDYYIHELKAFIDVARSGKSNVEYRTLVAPVYIIDATIKAYESGEEVKIIIPEL